MIIQDTLHELKSSAQCGDRSLALQVLLLLCCLSKCHKSCLELFFIFSRGHIFEVQVWDKVPHSYSHGGGRPEPAHRCRWDTVSASHPAFRSSCFTLVNSLHPACSSSSEADLSLHRLSESPCGSLVVYVIPESSSLLPEVQSFVWILLLLSI